MRYTFGPHSFNYREQFTYIYRKHPEHKHPDDKCQYKLKSVLSYRFLCWDCYSPTVIFYGQLCQDCHSMDIHPVRYGADFIPDNHCGCIHMESHIYGTKRNIRWSSASNGILSRQQKSGVTKEELEMAILKIEQKKALKEELVYKIPEELVRIVSSFAF